MGVYIDKFEPKYGLYQIDQGKIHKYKGKGGTVRVYPIQEIDLVRCGECKHYGFKETDRGGFPCCTNEIGVTPYRMPTDFCSYGERRADEHAD
mgnify:CR=1 FL=1